MEQHPDPARDWVGIARVHTFRVQIGGVGAKRQAITLRQTGFGEVLHPSVAGQQRR
jgi:hypothetical protein